MAKARAPQQIALLYAVVGCLWILFSDQLLALLWQEPRTILLVSQLKGWGYVLVTAMLLYWLIRRSTEQLVASERELREQGISLASADSLLRSQLAEVESSRQRLHELNQQLAVTHQLYYDLVNSIDGIVWELEIATFSFTFVSNKAEKLLGYPVERWLHEADFWTSHLHPGDRAWAVDFCQRATEAKQDHTFEYRFLASDGRIVWLRDLVTVVVENDRPVKLRGVMLDITEKRQAEEEIRQLNADLEQRVADRTAELAAVNRELESFSYSVSHDLRAPLRHIDGFSRALLEDCADQLDEKGRHHLERILAATRHLGALIDDLLQLARVSRDELWRHPFDLSELARDICRVLQEGEPARHVSVQIEDGLMANADPRLMRVALENLLGNAWKYTGPRAIGEIGVGHLPDTTPTVYFVRDNGVGFDMAFADKLFSPFQRLHHREEFDGTGVGLATVKRVLERHGGSIRAEAAVEEGATFYFTLDKQS